MAHPHHHAISSARKWGGDPEEYVEIHEWFDHSKELWADPRHRALRHHSEGIFMAETVFGRTLTLSTGRVIPVRWVGEQHVEEDLGFIPSMQDWFKHMTYQPWMSRAARKLSVELDREEAPVG